ncbi:hypothetical protein [uncultured Shimia sp.]|uniref:hypothetical protein n=1 Tax=uncultured Shimia sp. TaxID=573152 RepID=UPI0025D5A69E|nr:hypothetical protein [uncultured Shimia sp.]
MAFSIKFTNKIESDFCHGQIDIGAFCETFETHLNAYSLKQYQHQWKDALSVLIKERTPVALFTSINLDDDDIGFLWMYWLVPSETAGDADYRKEQLCNYPMQADAGYYVGQRFMFVTTEARNFERRVYMPYEDGSQGPELALYYLDLSAPDRIFGYLDDHLEDASHWYVSNEAIQTFFETL